MSELQPIIPREENQQGSPPIPHQETPEPVPITEQEVGEYREQDRFLPVSFLALNDD
jgi:nuclear transcription Y subunit beta